MVIITGSSKQSRFEETRLTLRIHRGRRSNSVPRVSPPLTGNHLKPSKSVETTSLDRRRGGVPTPTHKQKHQQHQRQQQQSLAAPTSPMLNATNPHMDEMRDDCINDISITSKSPILHMMQITLSRKENMESLLCSNQTNDNGQGDVKTTADGSKTIRGVGKRILKVQAKRFRMETKAAKTLAIIVGGFIVCWLPFFTMYLIRAFCQLCIQPLLFSILFWLGYCNSAINPLIYALFSKEFRIAFKTILYKCLCVHCSSRDMMNECSNRNLIQNSSADSSR